MGLRSANPLEQQAAISSLSTLMSVSPGETYLEFEKVKQFYVCYLCTGSFFVGEIVLLVLTGIFYLCQLLKNLPDRHSHDMLSETDIQVNSSAYICVLF